MSLVPFLSTLQNLEPVGGGAPGASRAQVTEDWLQGRSGFGGLMAAFAVTAMRRAQEGDRPLRALVTSFVGPVAPGAVDVRTEVLRHGKSVSWVEATLLQEGQVCTRCTGCFGAGRESTIHVPPARRPDCVGPEKARLFPFMPGITPNFLQHFEVRWAIGQMPMSGSKESQMGAWVRFRDPAGFGESHIVALMDLLPPAVMQMQRELKPISSLTWHLEMLDELSGEDALDGAGWWFFHVAAQASDRGYSQQSATLYTPAGRALAMSQQSIAVFA